MSIHSSCSFSNELVSYLIGETSEVERMKIESHLLNCPSCTKEIQELQEAWTMIPYEFEDVAVPVDLKDEVMNAIFSSENSQPVIKRKDKTQKVVRRLYGLAAAVLLIGFSGVIWNNINLRNTVTELREQANIPPEVIQVYSLKTANPTTDAAQGQAMLYKQGDKKQLVFQLKGLKNTKGSEAYQAWLIDDGNRRSAGTFHVDEQGNGFLTYQLQEDISFDAIGISLEPDANGTQPRGKKVLGT
ncbi:anti-sigma factor [Bacillus sp. sid0103]|uniref:anti-sigma factor n=1 Tax=Bacillus sp. sid0103 TaxID=2856337 RepID=UPI001C4480B0|nr:anti-sigma factor [Bacillus sp. sid0103]MBV7504586.1 anti-sigma factor [Bacillus sp. sid0103]